MLVITTLALAVALQVPVVQSPSKAPATQAPSSLPATDAAKAVRDTLRPRDPSDKINRDSLDDSGRDSLDDSERDSERDRSERRRRLKARRTEVTPQLAASAFADALAKELLLKARAARLRNDSSIRAYDATAYQRMSVGMGFKALGRERLAMRVENSAHIRWNRDVGIWMEITGSRVVMPMLGGMPGMKEAESEMNKEMHQMTPIPWYPGKDALWIGGEGGLARASVDESDMVHPLASGAEAYYRYATGDSITIALSSERRIRLRELRITAREPKWNLIVGSFWFDVSGGQLVRAVYRMSVPMDPWQVARENADSSDLEDMKEIPTLVKPLIFPMQAEIQSITVEYGLFNGVWMPRVQAIEAYARASFMRFPFTMEERYKYASVNVTDEPMKPITRAPRRRSTADSILAADSARRAEGVTVGLSIGSGGAKASVTSGDSVRRRRTRAEIQARADSLRNEPDSARQARRVVRMERDSTRARARRAECDATGFITTSELRYQGTLPVAVQVPCDTMKLLASKDLPPSIYDAGEELFGAGEREELIKSMGLGLQPGWAPRGLEWHYGLAEGVLRYNRVEGLSPGIGVRQTMGGGYAWNANARYNVGEATVIGDIGAELSDGRRLLGLSAYRRTTVASDWGQPFGFGASLASLLYARDEAFYYRSSGAEFTWRTEPSRDVEVRVFAERQDSMPVVTRYSLFGGSNDVRFVSNLQARTGSVAGVEGRLRRQYGLDPHGWRFSYDARGEVAGGDWLYQRGAVDLVVSRHLFGPFAASVSAGGGAAFGEVPPQRYFYLGGLHTVRGQSPGTPPDRGGIAGSPGGTAYWLARSELAYGAPAFRIAAFYDAGWTGRKREWQMPGRPMSGAGVGFSMLDGLIRLDIARGIFPRVQWRTDFSVEARF